ncbi:Beta-galactosidase [Pontiella desulfatans]|uniref:Beta-galactosidase n=1 Tax=Pontiella desulfatans TaxID=2750659 RepID=A0A6C2U2Z8_PONDE|nr:sugar-binding domain-containing protein [Pontiella desulfatans]VGO14179.1 Beta-galactosidase [Pontiella desulfatans]
MKAVPLFVLNFIMMFCLINVDAVERMDISGAWKIRLDPDAVGEAGQWFNEPFTDSARLPGSTAENGYGNPPSIDFLRKAVRDLDPRYGGPVPNLDFQGCAWYRREVTVPDEWKDKRIVLFLERARWVSKVWVNGTYCGGDDSLSTPHEIDISDAVNPGANRIVVCMDNRVLYDLGGINSGTSLHTQGMWNGIIGRMELIKTDPVYFDDLQVYPDPENGMAVVKAAVGNATQKVLKGKVSFRAVSPDGKVIETVSEKIKVGADGGQVEVLVPMGEDVILWDEFSTHRYSMEARLNAGEFNDSATALFGMRKIGHDNVNVLVNGKKVFLRGTLECANFPLTAYPSMELDYWLRLMGEVKANGLNHIRFHSWTPPEAAFEAADQLGLYLLTEATRANSGYNEAREEWVEKEMLRIQESYGNHPSFALFSGGNELQESLYATAEAFLEKMKPTDNRHLFAFGSGGGGMEMLEIPLQNEDFVVGAGGRGGNLTPGRLSKGNADGYYKTLKTPMTDFDRNDGLIKSNRDVPVIAHEIGQWCVFPSMSEIEKYTGVMQPDNLKLVRDDLEKKGMLEQSDDFTRVTAKHAAVLYKEEIEVMMRSRRSAGFQLLQLNDYSGQGTAHVGLYDAFWDSKEAMSSEEFRRFACDTVPLLRFSKFDWFSDEVFHAKAQLLNFGNRHLVDAVGFWKITTSSGSVVAEGRFEPQTIRQGVLADLGEFSSNLNNVEKAEKLTVQVGIEGTDYLNQWNIWAYPRTQQLPAPDDVLVSTELDEAVLTALSQGRKVLLLPTYSDLDKALRGRFLAPFWSPVHWWTREGRGNVSMSILCDPEHPALSQFPTDEHTNWQWCDLLDTSSSFILDDLPNDIRPIIQVVDNFSRNHKLANLLEVKVGEGKLLICGMDLQSDLEKRPVARQMRISLLEYMSGSDFSPEKELTVSQLQSLFKNEG